MLIAASFVPTKSKGLQDQGICAHTKCDLSMGWDVFRSLQHLCCPKSSSSAIWTLKPLHTGLSEPYSLMSITGPFKAESGLTWKQSSWRGSFAENKWPPMYKKPILKSPSDLSNLTLMKPLKDKPFLDLQNTLSLHNNCLLACTESFRHRNVNLASVVITYFSSKSFYFPFY